jgi:hypothetical protein
MKFLTVVLNFVSSHQLIFYYFIAVAIDQLPMPTPTSSGFYKWFFGFIQVAAANWNRGNIGRKGGPNATSKASDSSTPSAPATPAK